MDQQVELKIVKSSSDEANELKTPRQGHLRDYSRVHGDLSEREEYALKVFRKATKAFPKNASLQQLHEFLKFSSDKTSPCLSRLFDMWKDENSDTINTVKFVTKLEALMKGPLAEKMEFMFNVHDLNGNGVISLEELELIFTHASASSNIPTPATLTKQLAVSFMMEIDANKDGNISLAEFQEELLRHPELAVSLHTTAFNWIIAPSLSRYKHDVKKAGNLLRTLRHFMFGDQYGQQFYGVWVTAFLAICTLLVVQAVSRHLDRHDHVLVVIARGCGAALNFACAFVLLPVMRKFMTLIRSSWAGSLVPTDHAVHYHMLIGYAILVFGVVHGVAHMINYSRSENPLSLEEYMFTRRADQGWFYGMAGISGVVLLVIVIIMVAMSQPCVRHSGRFELFHYSHRIAFLLFFPLLFIHAPSFWIYLLLPLTIAVFEYISRVRVSWSHLRVVEATLLAGDVTELVIKRPAGFTFTPGAYVYLKLPSISETEWHPFTISSPPEQGGYFTVHIRSVGDWTRSVRELVQQQQKGKDGPVDPTMQHQPHFYKDWSVRKLNESAAELGLVQPEAKEEPPSAAAKQDESQEEKSTITNRRASGPSAASRNLIKSESVSYRLNIPVSVDGPFGAPANHIERAEHAVLIGAGVGVTPFASILGSLSHRLASDVHQCPNCSHRWRHDALSNVWNLKKVDFVWINRDQSAFGWFITLLETLEIDQQEFDFDDPFMDFHIYMTGAKDEQDLEALTLQMTLDLFRQQKGYDLITGLRTKTKPGRPDFDKLFAELKKQNKGKVTVFYCGPHLLGNLLAKHCAEHGFKYREENF